MFDIIIIGGGPAGLTAATYGLRANKKVLVIEKENFGGQIVQSKSVENYPGFKEISGMDLGSSMYEQAKNLGMEEVFGEASKITLEDKTFTVSVDKKEYQSKTVIVATGSMHRHLNISREEDYIGAGISYCATCDGAFFKDKIVGVIGGGNTAIADGLYLANLCQKVYMVHRRDSYRAEESKLDLLKQKENVIFIENKVVSALHGDEELTSVTLKDTINNEESNLSLDGLFIAIGQVPNTEIIENYVSLAKDCSAQVGIDCKTNIPGLFVAGDVRDKEIRQLTTAVADGTVSAMMAIDYLED